MSLFSRANRAFLNKDFEGAVDLYQQAIAQASGVAIYHENLGWALERLGQPERAFREYSNALALDSRSLRARRYISKAWPEINVTFQIEAKGIKSGRPAVKARGFEKEWDAIDRVKRKLFHLGLEQSAIRDFEELIATGDTNESVVASFELALYYINNGEPSLMPRAIDLLESAREKDRGVFSGHHYDVLLSEIYVTLGDRAKAAEIAEKCLRENPCVHDALFPVANLNVDLDDRLRVVNKIYDAYGLNRIESRGESAEAYNTLDTMVGNNSGRSDGPLVSVIVPAYNAEDTIAVALSSLLKQTWKKIEVIVVDDCSTDRTVEVVRRFCARDERVKLMSTGANSGPYVARNIALNACSGELVTCNDADDWSHAQKIETQVAYLLSNPQVIAASSRQVRATPELRFHRRGNAGFYIFDNMSSLMFRKAIVVDAVGYWDSVRFGADSEFIKRIVHVFGRSSVVSIKTAPLSFQRQAESSLTGSKTFGYHGNFFGARLEYKHAQENFHSRSSNFKYEFPMLRRPFAIPEPMRPVREVTKEGIRHFDVIIASEYRMNGGSVLSCIEEIKANAELGLRTGIVQLARFDQNPRNKILPAVRECLDAGLAEIIVFGEQATCDLLILRYPPCMQERQTYVPNITANDIRVVVNQPPMSDYGDNAEFRYSIPQVQKNIEALFGANITWHPIGPLVRNALHEHHSSDLSSINLSDQDWLNIVDIRKFDNTARCEVAKPLRVGRHARGYKWIKWPAKKAEILAVYPESKRYDVRILGGATAAEEQIGYKPKNWTVYGYGELSPEEFLSQLDVFVYYTHPAWVESFGRVIIEAMAAGLPVILDPVYKPLIGEAALYAEYHEVQPLLDRLATDREYYQQRSRASLQSVTERFSYEAHRNRVLKIISSWPQSAYSAVPNRLTNITPTHLKRQLNQFRAGNDNALTGLVETLLHSADEALLRGPFSVVDKKTMPPSGDPHDYWHPAPYWWPNPETADGLPYIRKDGERVPGTDMYAADSENFDRTRIQRLFDDTYMLSLAYLFSGENKYGQKAVDNIKVFFVDEKTRMNPHLQFAQVRMGHNNNEGAASGLIELKDFYYLVDAFRILENAKDFKTILKPLKAWLNDYLDWLLTSEQGVEENASNNNHGTYYDLQVLSIASYVGREEVLKEVSEKVENRIHQQVKPDGRLPEELKRRTTAHYCAYALQGWINVARTLEASGLTLSGEAYSLLKTSASWFISFYQGEWPYEQIDDFDFERMLPIAYYFGLEDKIVEPSEHSVFRAKPVFFPHDGIKPFWNIG